MTNEQLNIGRSALLTDIAMCLNYYRLFSPGLYCCVLAPVRLDSDDLIRPGVMLMVNYGTHKTADPDADGVDAGLCRHAAGQIVTVTCDRRRADHGAGLTSVSAASAHGQLRAH